MSSTGGVRRELVRAIASGRLTVLLVALGLLGGVTLAIRATRTYIDDTVAARAASRDAGECVLYDALLRTTALEPDARAAIETLRERNRDRAVGDSPCLLPLPAPGDPPRLMLAPAPAATPGAAAAPTGQGAPSRDPAVTSSPPRATSSVPATSTPERPPSPSAATPTPSAAPTAPPDEDGGLVGAVTETVCSLPVVGPVAC